LNPYRLSIVAIGVLLTSCSSPVCRPALTEQGGRCLAPQPEVTPKECEPTCSPGAHEVCDGDTESPSCVCAPGYEGNPCAWAGVLEDRGFENGGAWAVSRGATVLPFERGPTSAGIGFLAPSVACNAGALSQTVEMPDYAAADPLVAEVTYRARNVFGLSLGFDLAWTQLGQTFDDAWATERVCLGEAAYGGSVLVQIGAREQVLSCFDEPVGDIEVDHLSIVLADPGECPAPGAVLNPTGEADQGGWKFDTTGAAEAGFVEGVGRGGTSGVRLVRDANDRVLAWTKLSIPSADSLPSPALRFWWRGTAGLSFEFRTGRYERTSSALESLPLDSAIGSGSDENYLYCLPPWTHGNVTNVIFRSLVNSSQDRSELVIDDVEIVSDARCGTSTNLLDPGFDAGPARIMGVTHLTPFQIATLRTESSLSRTGEGGVLELSYWNEEAIMLVETWVLVPESNGDEGPAVVFWSNVPQDNEKPIRSVLGRAAINPADLRVGGGWLRNEVCLFPEWSGRWYRVQWRLGDIPPIGTAPIDPPIRIYIDDLELTTSSACRAN